LRQSTQDDATQEDAVLHGAPQNDGPALRRKTPRANHTSRASSLIPPLYPPLPPNRQMTRLEITFNPHKTKAARVF
jgi:hypothetical protein